jgi:hypothetical protein
VLAFTDEGIARLLIAASKFPRDADRLALLRDFARVAADPPRRRAWRSPAAIKQQRYRARDRSGVKIFRFPLSHDDLEFFAAARWISDEKLADHDAVVAAVLRELRALRSRYR